MKEKIRQALIDIVGEENYTDEVIDLISYSSDTSEHRHRPEGAVWPMNTEQVSKILKLANEELFPVTPRGAGTGYAGGAVPEKGGIVMDMSRMNKILKISIDDRLVVVQPGVVYAKLAEALAPYGFSFPPDPASGKAATLGGNVATNAGGLKGAKYGTTRDYVLGPGSGPARWRYPSHRFQLHEVRIGVRLDPVIRGFRGDSGCGYGDYPQNQSEA